MPPHCIGRTHIIAQMTSSLGHITETEFSVEDAVGNLPVLCCISSPGQFRPYQLGIVSVEVARLTCIQIGPIAKQTADNEANIAGLTLLEVDHEEKISRVGNENV